MFKYAKAAHKTKQSLSVIRQFSLLLLIAIAMALIPGIQTKADAIDVYIWTDQDHDIWLYKPEAGFDQHRMSYQSKNTVTLFNQAVLLSSTYNLMADPLFCLLPYQMIRDLNAPTGNPQSLPDALAADYALSDAQSAAQRIQNIVYFGFTGLPLEERTRMDYLSAKWMIYEYLRYSLRFDTASDKEIYPEKKRIISQRVSDWESGASYEGQSFDIYPGESVTVKDDRTFTASMMKLCGVKPGVARDMGQGVQMFWDGSNTLTFTAPENFEGKLPLQFKSPEEAFPIAYQPEDSQTIMMPSRHPIARSLSFQLTEKERLHEILVRKTAPALIRWQEGEKFQDESIYEAVIENRAQEGAVFALFQGGSEIARGRTDASGQLSFKELKAGDYLLKEIEAPDGYALSEDRTIKLTKDQKTPLQIDVLNQRFDAALHFVKAFSEGAAYEDEELCSATSFAIRNQNPIPALEGELPAGSLLAVKSPSPERMKEGEALSETRSFLLDFQLPVPCPLMLEEISTHADFIPAESKAIDFREAECRDGYHLEYALPEPLVNERRIGQLRVHKEGVLEDESHIPLENAVFSLWMESDGERVKVGEGSSDANGEAVLELKERGTYYLREERAPEGFICSEEEIVVPVDQLSEAIDLTVINRKEIPKPLLENMTPKESQSETEEKTTEPGTSQTEPVNTETESVTESVAPSSPETEASTAPTVETSSVETESVPLPDPEIRHREVIESSFSGRLISAYKPAVKKAAVLPKTGVHESPLPALMSLLMAAMIHLVRKH